jgi:hypothetical protein
VDVSEDVLRRFRCGFEALWWNSSNWLNVAKQPLIAQASSEPFPESSQSSLESVMLRHTFWLNVSWIKGTHTNFLIGEQKHFRWHIPGESKLNAKRCKSAP